MVINKSKTIKYVSKNEFVRHLLGQDQNDFKRYITLDVLNVGSALLLLILRRVTRPEKLVYDIFAESQKGN